MKLKKKILIGVLSFIVILASKSGYCLYQSSIFEDQYINIDKTKIEETSDIEISAHRGLSGDYLENSIESIVEACKSPYTDSCEMDVRLTKDNIPIVFHGSTINFKARGFGAIEDFNYSEFADIKIHTNYVQNLINSKNYLFDRYTGSYVLKKKFTDKGNTYICGLDYYIKETNDFNKPIILDLKADEENSEEMKLKVLSYIKEHAINPHKFILTSTNYQLLDDIKEENPDIKLSYIIKNKKQLERLSFNDNSYTIRHTLLTPEIVNSMKDNTNLYIWTVNSYYDYHKAKQILDESNKNINVTFISDYPEMIYTFLNTEEDKKLIKN